jgi:hypothetical protein
MNLARRMRAGSAGIGGFPVAAERPRSRPANDQIRRIDSRIVLSGCAALLSLIGAWSAMKALELQPPACRVSPVGLALGAETAATMQTGSGMACTVAVRTGSAVIDDITVTAQPRHGSIAPRGRTGAIYRPEPRYRGEDGFALALRGRSGTHEGVAVVRVRVTVR